MAGHQLHDRHRADGAVLQPVEENQLEHTPPAEQRADNGKALAAMSAAHEGTIGFVASNGCMSARDGARPRVDRQPALRTMYSLMA